MAVCAWGLATGRQILVLRRLPVKLIHGLDCTKTMWRPLRRRRHSVLPLMSPGGPSRPWQLIRFRHFIDGLLALASLEPWLPGSSPRRFRNAHHHDI